MSTDAAKSRLIDEIDDLRERLAEAEETLRAIRTGEVDALVISNDEGQQIFTLKGAEHGYRVLVQTMNEGAVTLSSDGTILYCNQNFAGMVQLPLEQVLGGDIAQFIPASERPAFARLHRGKVQRKGELMLQAAEGLHVPVFLSVSDLKVDGVPDAVCLVFTDLREQKRNAEIHAAREALLQSSQRYRSLIEATAQIIWTTDPRGQMRGDQAGWAQLTGQRPAEYEGYGWVNALHPDDRGEVLARWREAVAACTLFQCEHRLRRRDGEYRIFSARGVPVIDAGGNVREWVGAHADITEHKQIERRDRFISHAMEVLVSSLDYETMIDHFARLVVPSLGDYCFIDVVREDGRLERATWAHVDAGAFAAVDGGVRAAVPPADAVHHPVSVALRTGESFFMPDLTDRWRELITLDPLHGETLRQLAGRSLMAVPLIVGERRLGCVTMVFSLSGRRHTPADLEIAEDLGRRAALALEHAKLYRQSIERFDQLKRSEEALQRAKEQLTVHARELEQKVAERTARLAETVHSLEGVTYTIAHDLRAPLRSMEGLSSILVEDYGSVLDETGRDYAQRIQRAASRLDRLIQDLLTYGRLSQMDVPLAPQPLDEVMDNVLVLLGEEINARNASVVIERPLPSVIANAVLLEQIVANLVANGFKFVAAGTRPCLRVSGRVADGRARIQIDDNGLGIDPRYHERIFNVFERLHGREYAGTGMGLAIVRKSLDRMNGRVGLVSIPGQGSTFWFELPVGVLA